MKELLILISTLILASCGGKNIQTSLKTDITSTGEVIFVALNTDILSVKSSGYGKTENEANIFAQKQAIENLIYRGIANSPYNKPMINNEQLDTLDKKLKSYINSNYSKYIQQSKLISSEKKDKKYKNLYFLDINITSLRMALEQQGLVRKFGL